MFQSGLGLLLLQNDPQRLVIAFFISLSACPTPIPVKDLENAIAVIVIFSLVILWFSFPAPLLRKRAGDAGFPSAN